MADPIKLPPLPDAFAWKGPRKITAAELRARDLEVARVVREAARRVIDPTRYANEADRSVAWDHYHAICVLEFTHD